MDKRFLIVCFCFIFSNVFGQRNPFDVARNGTLNELKELILKNPKIINLVNDEENSMLILACYHGNAEVVPYLIENVDNINYSNKMGTALMAAVVKNKIEFIKKLLQKGANPNSTDTNGVTAVMYATMFKMYDVAELLIKYKANPEIKDKRGSSAIDYAIMVNDDKLMEILKSK